MTDPAVHASTPESELPGARPGGWGLHAATLAALGCTLLAGRLLSSQPVPALAWAALAAAPLGAWVGARGLLALLLAPGVWLLVEPGPRPGGALAAVAALALLGAGLGDLAAGLGDLAAGAGPQAASHTRPEPGRLSCACGLALLAALLTALPLALGPASGPGWDPALVAWTLDLSPVTLVIEAAGHDWLRDPAIYDAAGGDAIGPDLRTPLGWLAAGVPALVGCAALGAARARVRP